MSARVYSIPGQTEGRRKVYLEWTSTDLSSKLSLTTHVGLKSTIIKVFIILFPGNFQNKSVSSPFSRVSRYVLFLVKAKGRGRSFRRVREEGPHCEITLKSTWLSQEIKNLSFCEILNNPIPPLFFIRHAYK